MEEEEESSGQLETEKKKKSRVSSSSHVGYVSLSEMINIFKWSLRTLHRK